MGACIRAADLCLQLGLGLGKASNDFLSMVAMQLGFLEMRRFLDLDAHERF